MNGVATTAIGVPPRRRAHGFRLVLPPAAGREAPILVTVHGISRNAEEHAAHFAEAAGAHGFALLAPEFSVLAFPDYQRLGRAGRGMRADLALFGMLEEAGAEFGLAYAKIYLFGHSGGAQFVHRLAMAWPDRVARYVVSAAGWYSLPDTTVPFPHGIRPNPTLPGPSFDPNAFLRVPGMVLVGEKDIRRGRSLRAAPAIDAEQGTTRLERARRWTETMNRAAAERGLPPPIALSIVPDAGHRFASVMRCGGLAHACAFLFAGCPG